MKPVGGGPNPRLRIELTDIDHRARAMVGTQLCSMASAEVRPGRILKLQEYVVNIVSNKRVFIVLNFEAVGQAPLPDHLPPLLESTIRGDAPVVTMQGAQSHAQPATAMPNPLMAQNQKFPPRPANPPPPIGASTQAPSQQMPGGGGQDQNQAMYGNYGATATATATVQPTYGQAMPQSAQASFSGYGQRPQTGGYGGGSYQSAQQSIPAVQPNYTSSHGPVVRNEAPPHIIPIAQLNPYMNRWTIVGRCTSKSEMRRWSNAKGEGKVFSFDLLDKTGGEIRATAFNEQAEDFEPMIEVGGVYSISKGSLKPKRAQYNHTKHDFEISLERSTRIERLQEDMETQQIPQLQFQMQDIMSVQLMEKGKTIDVIGVVERVDPWTIINKKSGGETSKRSLIVRDKSNCDIELTLWGDSQAGKVGDMLQKDVDDGQHPIVAVKGARVGDFNGKNLSTVGSTQILINPDMQEAHELRQWFQGGGKEMIASSLSNQRASVGNTKRVHCSDITAQMDENGGQPAFVQIVAPIFYIRRENMYYPACTRDFSGRACNKKLREEGDGWFCERCGCESNPEWRYLLSINVKDHTGTQYLTAFGSEGTQIMGKSADELRELEGTDEFDEVISNALFNIGKFVVKVFTENYNDEQRVKSTVTRQEPFEAVKESQYLLGRIKKYLDGGEGAYNGSTPNNSAMAFGSTPGYQGEQQQAGYLNNPGVGRTFL